MPKLCAPLSRAFSRTELLVVVAVLTLLLGLLTPRRAHAKALSQDSVCANNLRQLLLAWQLYHMEHEDRLVMVLQGGLAQSGNGASDPRNAPWALGWQDWSTSPDNTNTLFLTDDRYSKLATYLGHSAQVFKCPSDVYVGQRQVTNGWSMRVRSVSASVAVGDGNADSGPFDSLYRQVRKSSEFVFPAPGDTYVYLDEHPDSINDPALFYPHANSWVDQPASYHNGAASFSFADGHCELHKWQGSLAKAAGMRVKYNSALDVPAGAGDPDIHWVSYRSPRVADRSY